MVASFDEKFNHTDYDVSSTYQASEGVNFYGRVATGYVTGGILRGTTFQPETVESYELGMKTTLLDNRLRINSAIFRMERDKLQTTFFGPTGLSLLNQGTATTDGLEIEATLVPIDGLTLNASLGLLSTDYSVTLNSPYPEMQVILSGQYDFAPLANGAYISVRADANYTDEYSGFTLPLVNTALEEALLQGDQWDLGLRASISDIPLGSTTGRLSLWGKNMLDNDKPEFVRNLFGYAGGSFQVPQTYGVDLTVNF